MELSRTQCQIGEESLHLAGRELQPSFTLEPCLEAAEEGDDQGCRSLHGPVNLARWIDGVLDVLLTASRLPGRAWTNRARPLRARSPTLRVSSARSSCERPAAMTV